MTEYEAKEWLKRTRRLNSFGRLIKLTAVGGDRNLIATRDQIATLDAESRRMLRLAVERLDDLLDADALDRTLSRSVKQSDE